MKKKNKRAMVAYYSGILFNTFRNIDMAHFIPLDNKIQKLVVGIDFVQYLHGYSYPWPPGGGVNKWDEDWEIGGYNTTTGAKNTQTNRIRSKNMIPVLPSTSYCFVKGTSDGEYILFYDSDGNYLSDYGYSATNTYVFTTPADCYYVTWYLAAGYGATYNNDISINYPATVTTYSPYSNICPITGHSSVNVIVSTSTSPLDGTITNIPLGQTVYCGTLDVVRGVLTVTHGTIDLGALDWAYDSAYTCFHSSDISDIIQSAYARAIEIVSDMFISIFDRRPVGSVPNNAIYTGVSEKGVYIKTDLYTDADEFKSFVNGHMIVYPLATSLEISLTPMQINTIVGSWNYVWCDTGQIIEIEA